jgi:hypothetical protein
MASRILSGHLRHRWKALVCGALAATCLAVGAVTSVAEAAVTDDPRAIPHDGIIGSCPQGSTVILGRADGIRSNARVTTTLSADGRYVSLAFASSLTGAAVIAYVKGGPAHNEYQVTVGTTDTTLLRAPLLDDGSLPVINHLLVCSSPPVVNDPPVFFVGYVDNFHGRLLDQSVPFLPSPWHGDPDVVFVGCTDEATCGKFDGGAIRIDNPPGNTVTKTLTAASVVIGPCTFTPWTALLPQAFGPGQKLVLTQTGPLGDPMPAPCREGIDSVWWPFTNFDTSERAGDSAVTRFYNCDGLGAVPVINLTFGDGTTMVVNDAEKILNTGGSDSHACFGKNEATPWTPIPA